MSMATSLRTHLPLWTGFVVLAMLWAACGDDTVPSLPSSDESESEESGEEVPSTSESDTSSEVEVPTEEETPDEPSRTVPEPEVIDGVVICTESAQCESELCVRFDTNSEEGLCADFCVTDEECQDGFACVRVRLGRDSETACVPTDFCLDRDGDGYGIGPGCRGPDCDDTNPDVYPGAPEFCNGIDNNCNGVADSNPVDVNLDCDTGLPGICGEGRTVCENGDLVCRPIRQPAEFETCNGMDMTCDGVVDGVLGSDNEPILLERPCYEGPSGTQGIGICRAGVRRCVEGEFGACEGQVLPGDFEVCDGTDTTCDGLVDNDPIDVGGLCDTGLPGICGEGVLVCLEGEVVCRAINQEAPVETCNGRDDTCDGLIDQVLNDLGEPEPLREQCYTGPAETRGRGICQDGWRTCVEGEWSACEGEVLPREEQCNGLDDNCDGLVDNADSSGTLLSEVCYSGPEETLGEGECRAGTRFCVEGEFGACVGEIVPQPETCDGRDNSCNGFVDQEVPGEALQRVCYDGPEVTRNEGECRDGVQTCTGGEWGRCDGQVLPSVEICNGLDNSCDGTVDSGNPGGGIPCNSGEPGICAEGTTSCNSALGIIECTPNILPGSVQEVCNGQDMNCDGTIDTGFDDLGTPCTVGLGVCQRTGVRICDPADETSAPVCNASPGTPRDEQCNFQDDSCDGIIDTPFRNAQGVYFRVEHCGACGVNCNNFWPGGPENFGVVPLCTVSGGIASCDYECLPGFVDADGIAENGCELQPDEGAIYVARPTSGGSDGANCGTWDSPCATIAHGLSRAQASNASRLLVSEGNFRETVTLVNGIDVLGGHNAVNWERNPEVFVSVITGQTVSGRLDQWAVDASGITQSTELSGFTIQAPNGRNASAGQSGGNSMGVRAINSSAALRIENNDISAGDGGAGGRGLGGENGSPGVTGGPGLQSINDTTSCAGTPRAGGNGGARTCSGGQNISGGAGANATCFAEDPLPFVLTDGPPTPTNPQPQSGQGSSAGAAGSSGHHLLGIFREFGTERTVVFTLTRPTQGTSGLPGGVGDDGIRGLGASSSGGSIVSNQWRGQAGSAGSAGTNGSGGGGGGAGGSIRVCFELTAVAGQLVLVDCLSHYIAATGGGGGSGGCAGTNGQGGGAGGGSFGVFIHNTGSLTGNLPTLSQNRISRAQAGDGGDGGNGGAGGEGGDGGGGGVADNDTGAHAFGLTNGADGGTGGRGGHGGGGGGGAGGISWDIFASGAGATPPDYAGSNSLPLAASVNTAGSGGTGGNSSNAANGIGTDGVSGTFGAVRTQ